MFQLSNSPSRTALINGKEFLFFSGYGYLGIQYEPAFIALVEEGIKKYGWLFPSSRISNTQLSIFDEMEVLLSLITHTTSSVCFASGFGAGTVASSLFKGHPITVCPESHPAVNKLHQAALSFDKWAEKTLHIIHENKFDKTPVLIADAVNPLTGEVNDFDFLKYIEKPLVVIVDDSHGIGLLGKNGEGIMGLLPQKENLEYIITYSLSKAMGINGGAISCTNKSTVDAIKKLPEFTASTSLSPALAHAFINGQKTYAAQRIKLTNNISFLRSELLDNTYIHNDERLPIFILPPYLDEAHFAGSEIIISSFAYPVSTGKKVNRVIVNALHTENDLQQLAKTIQQKNLPYFS